MKQRIQEALRRRHRKEDEGFTLIELLVVILIIAILAAVGIVALLGALRSGKKSAAKTTLSNAILSVKAEQTGNGATDFTGITFATLNASDPDINFGTANDINLVGYEPNHVSFQAQNAGTTFVVLASLSANKVCYFAKINADAATLYGSTASMDDCQASNIPSDSALKKNTKEGWDK